VPGIKMPQFPIWHKAAKVHCGGKSKLVSCPAPIRVPPEPEQGNGFCDMRKCTYCGREYPDGALRCLVDEQPLTGGEPPPPLSTDAPSIENVQPAVVASAAQTLAGAERRERIIEVVILCTVAFGGSILVSTYRLFNPYTDSSRSSWGALSWMNSGLHE